VLGTAGSLGIGPWQNGVADGSCRRDLVDHVIVLNEHHLKRLMADYVHYFDGDRTHLGLEKQIPAGRQVGPGVNGTNKVVACRG
jgi:hypothetical protein